MAAESTVPEDWRALANDLFREQTGVLTSGISELAALFDPARNVRVVPAQRASYGTITLTADQLAKFQIIGRRADVKSITLAYHGIGTDTETDIVRVGASLAALQAVTPANAYLLNPLVRTVRIEVNEDDVYVGLGAQAADADGPFTISWVIEEYDPNATIERRR